MKQMEAPDPIILLEVKLAGCTLGTPGGKKNWVDETGGLPQYICEVAKDIRDSGHSTSSAIAIAVGRVKVWAATSKDATVRAKAAKALAEWNAKKARAHVWASIKQPKRSG